VVAALVIATAGIAGALVFDRSLDRVLSTPARNGWTWNATCDATLNQCPTGDALASDESVESAAVLTSVDVIVGGRTMEAVGVRPVKGALEFAVIAGRAPAADNEVALGADAMRAFGVDVGDEVEAAGVDGDVVLRVVGRAVFPNLGDELRLADTALFTAEGLARVNVQPDDAAEYVVARASPDAVQRHGFDDAQPLGVELRQLADIEALPVLVGIFVGLLGVGALVHVLVASMAGRRRELAVLRAIGVTARGTRAIIRWQAVISVSLGLVIGIPLGVLVGTLAWRVEATNLGVATDSVVPAVIAMLIPGALLVGILCTALPAWRAARLHPAEILRSE
jgi:putative ABC transport system permease protein